MLDWLFNKTVEKASQTDIVVNQTWFSSLATPFNDFIVVLALSFFILLIITRGKMSAGTYIMGSALLSYLWNFWVFK
jgi:uncharacterized membrane protein YdfJ with MMPL/SSD domain